MIVLKNYTTKINFNQTISEIESLLASLGAKKIMKEYDDDGNTTSMIFDFELDGKRIPIKLPARIDRIPTALRRLYNEEKDSGRRTRLKTSMNKPSNIGWRIMKDWLEANIAIMQLDQINMMEALLPFSIVKDGKTLYELLEENKFEFNKMAKSMIGYDEGSQNIPKEESKDD